MSVAGSETRKTLFLIFCSVANKCISIDIDVYSRQLPGQEVVFFLAICFRYFVTWLGCIYISDAFESWHKVPIPSIFFILMRSFCFMGVSHCPCVQSSCFFLNLPKYYTEKLFYSGRMGTSDCTSFWCPLVFNNAYNHHLKCLLINFKYLCWIWLVPIVQIL